MSTPIKQAQTLGYKFDSKVLDLMNVDVSLSILNYYQKSKISCLITVGDGENDGTRTCFDNHISNTTNYVC